MRDPLIEVLECKKDMLGCESLGDGFGHFSHSLHGHSRVLLLEEIHIQSLQIKGTVSGNTDVVIDHQVGQCLAVN